MKVINFYAGPCTGKTTIAAAVFVELKKIFSNVEINLEYARKLIAEDRTNLLQSNQLYVFAKQEKLLHDLMHKNVEYIITDSPILLSTVYNNPELLDQDIFERLAFHIYEKYNNINFYINRNPEYGFDPRGRMQCSVGECVDIDVKIKSMLEGHHISFYELTNNKSIVDEIVEIILKEHMKKS